MRKAISLAVVLLLCTVMRAQDFWHQQPIFNPGMDYGRTKNFLAVTGFYNFGSDGVNNEFLTKLYHGGYMDSSFVEKSSGALLPSNRFGVMTTMGITYGHYVSDTSNEMLTVSLWERNSITGRFPDDAFHLGFQGNTRYKGEEADFSGTRFTAMSWSQLKIGYITPQKDGGVIFSFSLLAGHHYNQADIHYGKLFTDSQGLFVSGAVAADYWSSDTTNRSAFALNGWGTSVDVSWYKHWSPKAGESSSVKLDFIDFGFINWNNHTIHRYTDTSFTYSGVDISQLFLDPDYLAELPTEEEFIKSDTTEFHRSVFLPAVIRASYQRTFFISRLYLKAEAAVPLWCEALPYGCISAKWMSYRKGYGVEAGVAYGGYARLQVPVKVELFMIRRTALAVGTTNALGFILPATLSGSGAYAKLSYCF